MQSEHEEDVVMDAPLISTLAQEVTSPGPSRPSSTNKRLLLKLPRAPMPPSSDQEEENEEEAEEEEEEEDQLIDDDSDMPIVPSNLPASSSAFALNSTGADNVVTTPSKGKRKRTKSSKRGENDERRFDESLDASGSLHRRGGRVDAASVDTPLEDDDAIDQEDGVAGRETGGQGEIPPLRIPASKTATKKRGGARKTGAASSSSRGRAKAPKLIAPQLSQTSQLSRTGSQPTLAPEEPIVINEDHSVTAVSSPGTIPRDIGSPEPDNLPILSTLPSLEEFSLEGVPLPIYPLPTKPFPVQQPAKIQTGFAPPLVLNKSALKVRRWRPANREIKGIAGGRWFARCWAGEKESELASSIAAASVMKVQPSTPGEVSASAMGQFPLGTSFKAAALSATLSAPPGTGIGKLKGRPSKAPSVVSNTSEAGSRAASTAPDLHAVKESTKLRTTVTADDDDEPVSVVPDAGADLEPETSAPVLAP